MGLNNIDKFFAILEDVSKIVRDNCYREISSIDEFIIDVLNNYIGISIPIFRNDKGNYDIYFGLNAEKSNFEKKDFFEVARDLMLSKDSENKFILGDYKKLLGDKPLRCLKDVSEKELHCILFAYNMKYCVFNYDVNIECDYVSFATSWDYFCKIFNEPLVLPIYIHMDNRNSILNEHLKGTIKNFLKYVSSNDRGYFVIGEDFDLDPSISCRYKWQDVVYNYRQDYRRYVEMLEFYMLGNGSIEEAYRLSYKEFEEKNGSLFQNSNSIVLKRG